MCPRSSQITMEKTDSFPFGVNEIMTMSRSRQIQLYSIHQLFPETYCELNTGYSKVRGIGAEQ